MAEDVGRTIDEWAEKLRNLRSIDRIDASRHSSSYRVDGDLFPPLPKAWRGCNVETFIRHFFDDPYNKPAQEAWIASAALCGSVWGPGMLVTTFGSANCFENAFRRGFHPHDVATGEIVQVMRRCALPNCSDSARDSRLKLCGHCRRVYYCCREHQKLHWPVHKASCKVSKRETQEAKAKSRATLQFLNGRAMDDVVRRFDLGELRDFAALAAFTGWQALSFVVCDDDRDKVAFVQMKVPFPLTDGSADPFRVLVAGWYVAQANHLVLAAPPLYGNPSPKDRDAIVDKLAEFEDILVSHFGVDPSAPLLRDRLRRDYCAKGMSIAMQLVIGPHSKSVMVVV